MGRSRGGQTTKFNAVFDAEGRPIRLDLTAGQANDSPVAIDVLDELGEGAILLADKAYETDASRAFATNRNAWANILPKANRAQTFAFSKWVYRPCSAFARFFKKLKQFRGIATRYDKNPDNFLAAVKLVATHLGQIVMSSRSSENAMVRLGSRNRKNSSNAGEDIHRTLDTSG